VPPRRCILLVAILASLSIAACSGPGASDEASPASDSNSQASAGAPEISELTVGVLPIVDVAPVHLAIEAGLFEREGLAVTPELVQGGAAAIPALQAGDLDLAYGAWPSFLIANQQGIDLRAVTDGVAATNGFSQLLAAADSGLAGNPAGLAGLTVALNTLGNIGELTLRETLTDAGLDYDDVSVVEIPFPEMGAALDTGSVDVIWASEPGVTANTTSLGAVTVVDSYVDDMSEFPVAGYFATAEFAAANPNTVAAFTRAIQEAAEMLNGDPDRLVEVVAAYTELPVELLEEVSFPVYRGDLDAAQLERVYGKLLEHGLIDEGLDVRSLALD
jgi:NitT/TauT family transport system substrate-binding protein